MTIRASAGKNSFSALSSRFDIEIPGLWKERESGERFQSLISSILDHATAFVNAVRLDVDVSATREAIGGSPQFPSVYQNEIGELSRSSKDYEKDAELCDLNLF